MAKEKPRVIELWNPHPKQFEILNSPARYKVIVCGRRFGKTTLAVNVLVKQALEHSDSTYWYVAPTYSQGKMIAWRMLLTSLEKLPDGFVIKTNESELYVVLFNGSYIHIKGADNPDSLRGVGLNGVILDEYADFRPRVFAEIIEPTLLENEGWAIFIGTPKGFNHFYEMFMKAKADTTGRMEAFRFTSYDNTSQKKLIKELNRIKDETPEDIFAQEYLADFRKRSDLVYKEFDRDNHIYTDPPDRGFVEIIAGMDFGYTNPYSLLVIGIDYDNNFWIQHEEYETNKTNSEIVEKAKNLNADYQINSWYPDPAEPDRIDELRRARINCRDVNKDVTAGIDRLRNLFKANRIRIHRSCKNLLAELESYHYPEDDGKQAKFDKNMPEKPVKEDDHALDALRYALFTHSPHKVELGEEFSLYESNYN